MSEPTVRPASRAPSPNAGRDLASWARLRDAGTARAQKAADAWRNGLAGFVTLLLSALVLKGSDLADVPEPFKSMAIICCLGGTLLAIGGLWLTLLAEAPGEAEQTYSTVIEAHGSISGYEQAVANSSQCRLRRARLLVLIALLVLSAGIATWWFAPPPAPADAHIRVAWETTTAKGEVCGVLAPSPDGELVMRVGDGSDVTAIKLEDVRKISPSKSCG